MNLTEVSINGDTWVVRKLTPKEYRTKHGTGTLAMTVYNHDRGIRYIDFTSRGLCKSTVVHEVTHAYLSYVELSRLSCSAIEEKFCDLLGSKGYLIMRVSRSIYRALRGTG